MKGLVSLVGAGPGDPELLTLKALKRIQEADLIVYDYLANPAHLRHAKKNATTIGVGKGFRHKLISQEKINRLIVSSAKKGQHVVRLKGGDPYLFGRGGEEALHLVKHRVPFEVVPGVTSATACAAYAGIPLTHRDHNASVTFLTGHRAGDSHLDSIRWKKIAEIGGTLVIYMGFYNLEKIAAHLMRAGLSVDTPVAVIEWGTLPRQQSIAGTLKNIAQKVKKQKLAPPCLIIIGDVVTLKNKLAWYEALPLFGKKVVITRAIERLGSFSEKLTALGAEVWELPLIQIESLSDFKEMDKAIRQLQDYDWVVFSSAYGVEAFFRRLQHHRLDARALAGVKIASVGSQTSHALAQRNLRIDLEPIHFETKAILQSLRQKLKTIHGKKFLLLRTQIAPHDLDKGLKSLGAEVHRLTAYKTVRPKSVSPVIKNKILQGSADFITFTSSSTVEHFIKFFGKTAAQKIGRTTKFLSIGPVTTKTLKSYGLKPYRTATTFTTDGLIQLWVK